MRQALDSAAGRLAAIRLAYLVGTAYTLLWVPIAGLSARGHGASYGIHGDLLLRTFDRWDSRWFTRIVEHGYATKQAAAFFPVYPLLVRGAAWVFRNDVAAGMFVSLVSAAVAAWLLERVARRRLPTDDARVAVLLLALYPVAFVFTAVYSDGLFLLFVLAAVDAADRGRPLVAALAAALAVDTRLLGLALLPSLVLMLWPDDRRAAAVLRVVPVVLAPLAALALWLLYLHVHYGDWLAFSHAEQAYWERRTPSPSALWHELRTLDVNFSNLVGHIPRSDGRYPGYVILGAKSLVDVVCLGFAAVLSWVAWRRFGAALGLFSVLTLAVVVLAPAAQQPLVSLPRFLLADFPLFLAGAALLASRPRAREIVYATFAALGAAAAIGFAHAVGIA